MREIDPLITGYVHLKEKPREAEALKTLQRIASLVKPLMRQRGWRVGTLAEFYPPEPNLLGINWNKGQQICLRLRYPGDERQFLPLEQVLDTMLHELAHIIWGAHDANFHALWQQLRDEHEQLARKGYTGEGFLSQGHKLGGRRIPMDEARRRARASAEKRKVLNGGSGQRLGGVPVRRGADIRKVIADAAQSRINVTKGCGSGAKDTKAIVEQATKNGFRTQAEEDDATERAIMEAYIEMLQEEEKEKWGEAYVPASASNPGGSVVATGGDARNVDRRQPPPATASTGKAVSSAPALPLSTKPAPPAVPAVSTTKNNTPKSSASTAADSWTCPTCTLQNPFNYLCCDACGLERPDALTSSFSNPSDNHRHSSSMKSQRHPASSLSSSLKSNTKKDREMDKKVSASRSTPAFWICHVCDTVMETQWWTCSSCGAMKLSS